MSHELENEAAVRALVMRWAQSVRDVNYAGILASHAHGILMFDVPPPLQSVGIAAYRATWDLFFAYNPPPVVFDFDDLAVTAGDDVAFVTALMHCNSMEEGGQRVRLPFRLTMGLRKLDGAWTIVHEHHSLPAE